MTEKATDRDRERDVGENKESLLGSNTGVFIGCNSAVGWSPDLQSTKKSRHDWPDLRHLERLLMRRQYR